MLMSRDRRAVESCTRTFHYLTGGTLPRDSCNHGAAIKGGLTIRLANPLYKIMKRILARLTALQGLT